MYFSQIFVFNIFFTFDFITVCFIIILLSSSELDKNSTKNMVTWKMMVLCHPKNDTVQFCGQLNVQYDMNHVSGFFLIIIMFRSAYYPEFLFRSSMHSPKWWCVSGCLMLVFSAVRRWSLLTESWSYSGTPVNTVIYPCK